MAISFLINNKTNFQDIRDRGETMNALDFDAAFSQIVNFINDEIITELNQLLSGAVPGSTNPVDINKFRRNIGNGTTEWASIGNDALDDFSLELSKLSKCTPCSILATGVDKIFREVTTDQSNFTLISQTNNLPVWRKLKGENIEDRQVTGNKITFASLTNENFEDNLLITQLLDDSITGFKVINRTIPGSKIEDEAIDTDILGDLLNRFTGRQFFTVILWGNTLPDGFIANPNYFVPGSNSTIYYYHLRNDFKIPLTNPISWGGENLTNNAIANYQIANRSLDGTRLNQYLSSSTYRLPRDINDLIADGSIAPANLPASYRAALGL